MDTSAFTSGTSSDALHIDLREPWEILLWTTELGCEEDELRRAVAAVGNVAGDVRRYLTGG